MKYLLCLICFCCLQMSASAQSQLKAEKAFLKELNSVLQQTHEQHWAHAGSAMTIDSAFALHDGVLSVTVRYSNDTSFTRVRMSALVGKLTGVAYDLYLILESGENQVTIYESEPDNNELHQTSQSNLFHIGVPQKDGYKQKEKLQKLLDNVLTFYRK